MIKAWPAFLLLVAMIAAEVVAAENVGSRFAYLDERTPYYPHAGFPKLTTPMWVGEPGVDAVILLSIDDMGRPGTSAYGTSPQVFAEFLEPLVARLKQIDGRAPITIFTCQTQPADPQLQRFLADGLSLDCHAYTHPVPLMRVEGKLALGPESLRLPRADFLNCLENLCEVPHNRPVAFRTPGCDAANTLSPRFFTEIFPLRTAAGKFLECDSSVMMAYGSADDSLPRAWRYDAEGRERFAKYTRDIPQTKHFFNFIRDYPYPYVIDRIIWELPGTVPGDSHGVHKFRAKSPRTVDDWQRAVDITVCRQGLMTIIFHVLGYIDASQLAEVVDYADRTYGKRVKFLNCREIRDRLTENLLAGQPLRSVHGDDNGVRLFDVNADGFLDVVIGNRQRRETRLWEPESSSWRTTAFPTALVESNASAGGPRARFFTASANGFAGVAVATPSERGTWRYDGRQWSAAEPLPEEVDGTPLYTSRDGVDRGLRFRDLDGDGFSDLIVNNDRQNAVYCWRPQTREWRKAAFALPDVNWIVNANGEDAGLRWVDLDADGHDDLVLSNERHYAAYRFTDAEHGWSQRLLTGQAGAADALPPITRGGALTGVSFHSGEMILVNEFTATLKDRVERHPFAAVLRGETKPAAD